MKIASILLSATTIFNLAACHDLDDHSYLSEQMSRAGNLSDDSLQCGGSQAVNISDLKSAWVYEFEGQTILQFSNSGLMCGEELDLEGAKAARSCSLLRDGWTKRIALPKDSMTIGTYSLFGSKDTYAFVSKGKNDHGCGVMEGGGSVQETNATIRIDELSDDCIRGSLAGLDKFEGLLKEQPFSLDWSGDFVAQRCILK